MSRGFVSVEVGPLRRYPEPPTGFEVDIVGIDLRRGTLARNQNYRRHGLLGVFVPQSPPEAGRDTRIFWASELMKYSHPALEIVSKRGLCLMVVPGGGEGRPVALEPHSIRPFVKIPIL